MWISVMFAKCCVTNRTWTTSVTAVAFFLYGAVVLPWRRPLRSEVQPQYAGLGCRGRPWRLARRSTSHGYHRSQLLAAMVLYA